jgi:hypothetical protein
MTSFELMHLHSPLTRLALAGQVIVSKEGLEEGMVEGESEGDREAHLLSLLLRDFFAF